MPHLTFPARRDVRRRTFKALTIAVQTAVVLSLTLSGGFGLGAKPAQAAAASVWTTQVTCAHPADQDANEYANGDHIYVRGKNFIADTDYFGQIHGQPG